MSVVNLYSEPSPQSNTYAINVICLSAKGYVLSTCQCYKQTPHECGWSLVLVTASCGQNLFGSPPLVSQWMRFSTDEAARGGYFITIDDCCLITEYFSMRQVICRDVLLGMKISGVRDRKKTLDS